jgi:hypothetical protein
MSLPENLSLNNITDLLKEIAEKHNMLKGFEVGEEAARGYSDKEKKELAYPYLWVDYGTTNLNVNNGRISDKVYNLRLFVADKHYDNIKSEDEILSDTEAILSDVVQWVLTHPDLKRVMMPNGSISLNPAKEATKDDVFGWFGQIPFRIAYKYCYQNLPIDKPC